MKTTVVFLLLLGVAFARGDATPDKTNQLETKNVPQVAKPSGLQTASTRNGDPQIAHMQYQANRLENQDMKYHQRSQLQNSQSFSQNQASQIHNQDMNQQFRTQSQSQFHSQNPAQSRQFHQNQNGANSANQEISSLLQSQQRMTPMAVSTMHAEEHMQRDFDGQQVYSSQGYPEGGIYQDRSNMEAVPESMNERRFDDFPQGQSRIISGVQSTMKTSGFPQVYHQSAAVIGRQQPILLPGVSQTHSTSVVVSQPGLKNLPVLPALVYSGAPVPPAHAVAYSRPWFHGGAYLKQHWQTPYARYVYSHIL